MAGELARLFVSIMGDTKGLDKSLKDTDTKLSNFQQKMQNMGQTLSKIGTKMTTFVTLPLLGLGAAAVKIASDAEEMRSKFNVVFGDMANQTEQWAEVYGGSINRSKLSLMEFASTLQDTFVPMGFARDEAAKFSTSMVELASDVGSFNNVATPDVIRDFQSALVGNHETVRKYGIVITQATLEQELMNMGLATSIDEATEQEKVLARMNIIMAGTADAHGDAARTAGSFANQMRGLKEDFKDVFATVGDIVIPYLQKLIGWIEKGIEWFKGLDEKTQKLAVAFLAITAAIGPALLIIGKLIAIAPALGAAITVATGPIGIIIMAIAGLVTAGIMLYKHWDKVSAFLITLWENIANFATKIFAAVKIAVLTPVREILEFLINIAGKLGKVFKGIDVTGLQNALDKVNGKLDDSKSKLEGLKKPVTDTKKNIKDLEKEEKEIAKTQDELNEKIGEGKEKVDDLDKSIKDLLETGEKYDDSLVKRDQGLTDYMEMLDSQRKSEKWLKEGQDELDESLKKLLKDGEQYNDSLVVRGEALNVLCKGTQDMADWNKNLKEAYAGVTYEVRYLTEEEVLLNEQTEKQGSNIERNLELIPQYYSEMNTIGEEYKSLTEIIKEQQAEEEKLAALRRQKVTEGIANAQMLAGMMNAIYSEMYNNRRIKLDNQAFREKEALNTWYNERLEAIENMNLTDEERAQFLEDLETERTVKERAMEQDLEKERRKIARDQAATEKKAAIFGIITNTALAIVKALTAGPIKGLILAGVIGAMGAAQLAAVSRRPLPALQEGALLKKPTVFIGGEGRAEEAVIPLNEEVFRDFAKGILEEMQRMRAGGITGRSISLHIGTLVADDYGLKKLERKLRDIRIVENVRMGYASG